MSDQYLYAILQREAVDTSIYSPLWQVQGTVTPSLQAWAGQYLLGISASGSFAKGTANRSGTDIDLFVSVHQDVPATLAEIYETLFQRLSLDGYRPRKQNVSIGIKVNGFDVDVVPGKRQTAYTTDHSLYRNRAATWTKTNITTHINTVIGAGRQAETRVLKLWRNQKGLDFPSFYLELAVIEALQGHRGTLSQNVAACLAYFRDNLARARFVDPANGNNVISDDLSAAAKTAIQTAAMTALGGQWEELVR